MCFSYIYIYRVRLQSNVFTDNERLSVTMLLHDMMPAFLAFTLRKGKEKEQPMSEAEREVCASAGEQCAAQRDCAVYGFAFMYMSTVCANVVVNAHVYE